MAGPSSPAKARFHPEAQAEYLEVIAYLHLHAPGNASASAPSLSRIVPFFIRYKVAGVATVTETPPRASFFESRSSYRNASIVQRLA